MRSNYRIFVEVLCTLAGFILILSCLTGCAQWDRKSVTMGQIDGDVWIRSIASDNQYHQNNVTTNASLETPGIPSTQIPPVAISYKTTGMFAGHSVRIESVSGSVFIEEAANRNQGIDVQAALEKLFKPGDPFAVSEN